MEQLSRKGVTIDLEKLKQKETIEICYMYLEGYRWIMRNGKTLTVFKEKPESDFVPQDCIKLKYGEYSCVPWEKVAVDIYNVIRADSPRLAMIL